MIDIHCHILPGIDDGAKSLSDSILMAKKAAEQGIHTIVASPHHKNGRYENPQQFIIDRVKDLNEAIRLEKIDLEIIPGQEVRIHGEMLQGFEMGEILPVNHSSYVLVEFPSNHVPRYAEKLFYDIQMKGLVPVIVHPERNQEIIERPEILYTLVKKGAITQVTAASVCGDFGKKIKNLSLQFIEANLTHIIASDAHNVTSRGFKMRDAFSVIEKKYGIDLVYMFEENAALLIEGKHVYKEDPEHIKRKKLFNLF
jgi:protein-tyrosine phosphatase